MLSNKKPKVKRMRGTNSHGWGHKKKHRGAGHRGGKGLAGTGRGGDSQKTSILSSAKSIINKIAAQKGIKASEVKKIGNKYFGKRGFTSVHKKNINTISISYIENNYDKLVENKVIDKNIFDTTKFKIDKVLGSGNFTKKITIICNDISKNAKAKIEAAGGKVQVLGSSVESSQEE